MIVCTNDSSSSGSQYRGKINRENEHWMAYKKIVAGIRKKLVPSAVICLKLVKDC